MLQKLILLSLLIFPLVSCKKDDKPATKFHDYTFHEPVSSGKTFYLDPVNGSMDGDGSEAHPWSTLQEVIDNDLIQYYKHTENNNADSPLELVNENAPVKGGDVLVLLSGYHGFINRSVFMFNDWLTIKAKEGNTPILSQIKMTGAIRKIYFKNLTILKESYVGTDPYWEAEDVTRNTNACAYFSTSDFWGRCSEIVLNGLTLKTAENTSSWTAEDWVEKAANGIGLRSVTNAEIVNCHLENIAFGISIDDKSDYTNVVNNTVKGFSGDGARIISSNVLFAYNTITDCYKVDDNHDDGIQSWSHGENGNSGGGVVYNVTLRGNTIIGTTDPTHPLAGSPQGIGCFDGMFDGWTVENNVVIVNHYHGISFYGFLNSSIVNNTVIDMTPGDDISPWILITDHKNGTPSENCIVANNIAFRSISVNGKNVEQMNNYIVGRNTYENIYNLFVDPDNLDFHLIKSDTTTKNIIDKGLKFNDKVSSKMDRDEASRVGAPDIGAYELNQ
ncbi:MAG: right-handed parallel beta-helix repeat-containing protein [Bacteroidales bacterium]|nr:right-handed parallel beta-helix repeat-containing protein [Bacteroidales bacterium]